MKQADNLVQLLLFSLSLSLNIFSPFSFVRLDLVFTVWIRKLFEQFYRNLIACFSSLFTLQSATIVDKVQVIQTWITFTFYWRKIPKIFHLSLFLNVWYMDDFWLCKWIFGFIFMNLFLEFNFIHLSIVLKKYQWKMMHNKNELTSKNIQMKWKVYYFDCQLKTIDAVRNTEMQTTKNNVRKTRNHHAQMNRCWSEGTIRTTERT